MAITINPVYPIAGETVTITATGLTGNVVGYSLTTRPTESASPLECLFVPEALPPADKSRVNRPEENSIIHAAEAELLTNQFVPDVKGVYTIKAFAIQKYVGSPKYDGDPAGEVRFTLLDSETAEIHVGDYSYMPIVTSDGHGARVKLQINDDTIRGAWIVDEKSEESRIAALHANVTTALTSMVGQTVDSAGNTLQEDVNELLSAYENHRISTDLGIRDVSSAILYDDSDTSYTYYTAEANDATTDDIVLLPASGALEVGDIFYIGSDNKFSATNINVSTAGVGSWALTWEYPNSAGWQTISGITDGTNGFTVSGSNQVYYTEPSDWVKTVINGNDYYWIRGRVTTGDATPTTRPLGATIDIVGNVHTDSPDTTNVMSRTVAKSNEGAIALLVELGQKIDAHFRIGDWHFADDSKNIVLSFVGNSLESAIVFAADLRNKFSAHLLQVTEPPTHGTADTTNALSTSKNLASVIEKFTDALSEISPSTPTGESDGFVIAESKYGFRE